MSSIRALYKETLLARGKAPSHRGAPEGFATHTARGENAVCGDRVLMALDLRTGRVRFSGHACLLCTASADVCAELTTGLSREARATLVASFLSALARPSGESPADDGDFAAMPSVLSAFSEVRNWPIRLGCVRLPWETIAKLEA